MHINQDSLQWAHPLIREWFTNKFGSATAPQIQGWPSILAEKTTLISAPTGTGKTLAAFLVCLDKLLRKALKGELENKTEVLYVSPLKALVNDIHKNLTEPLAEIMELARKKGLIIDDIRVAVRTGDTLTRDRVNMLKKPPHILATTPESLYILLTAEKSRAILTEVSTVIVDEIHAMINDKRGTHLSLSLERLEAITSRSPNRIGLSATQKPIEVVAEFLTGNRAVNPEIINIGHLRELDLAIEVPRTELGAVASNEMWDEIYDRIAELSASHRSILVFVNTRRLAERVAHHLAERLGEENIAAHHGSLSRKLRLSAESRLKNGELKILVATASLELGIDIGSIDLVCQIGSTHSIAVALQRVGRAGHWHGGISKGRFFATTRDELIECAALIKAIREGDLDKLILPREPLDILMQQIVAICATGDWKEKDLFKLITKAHAYKNLSLEKFNALLEILSEGISGSRNRYGAYLFRDQINHVVKARRGARLNAITSGGAIPDNAMFTVMAEPDELMVGTLDEDFAIESNRGDIILLGTTSWKINRIESSKGRVIVENAHGAPPSVPFWLGESPGRTKELSAQVANLREKISESNEIQQWLKDNCGLNDNGANQLVKYIYQGKAVLGAVPTQSVIIAERFFDESGGMQLIIHSPFGSRINKAWGLALRKKFCRSFNFELQAAATEDGINISLFEKHSFPLADVFKFLHPNSLKEVLIQAVLQSPLFKTRWRWDATRSLALLRFRHGKKTPPNIQRMLSEDLLASVFPDAAACQDNLAGQDIVLPDHPLIEETMKDALEEALDLDGLLTLISKILDNSIQCIAVDTPVPSPFAHEILNANPYAFLDDAPLEERRARAVNMRSILSLPALENLGKLDPVAISEVQAQAWPDIRNKDELHDVLQTVIAFPAVNKEWEKLFELLVQTNRASIMNYENKKFWVAAEKKDMFNLIPNEEVVYKIISGWMRYLGPVTHNELSKMLLIDAAIIESALLKLETSGMILRGHFRELKSKELEWCERHLLSRIHRATLDKLRKQIEPVSKEQFFQWLLSWQHLSPGSQLSGENGLLEVISQLQGFEIPAKDWEQQILAKRVTDYQRDTLDRLCLMGIVGWGRLSPYVKSTTAKRVRPSSNALITFFVREESIFLQTTNSSLAEDKLILFSHAAKSIYDYLKQKGASFFPDIVQNVHHLKSEIETGLWELITAGIITADSFDNLRALIDPNRRSNRKRRRVQARFSTGRWSILSLNENADSESRMEEICWVLLKRYGVVFRDLLYKEKNIPRWRELLPVFRQLEAQGKIRGGRFVHGFAGEQFALPYAISSLREMRKKNISPAEISIAATDPLSLDL